ncbi:MAG: hypothetical protein IJF66_02890 [Clostridia bacterium]|nr:hypothetical protein [Clostridia bacterium]
MKKSLKSLSISILVVLLFSAVLPICFVSAEEIEVFDFDSSSVIDDLTGSTIWNEPFDISNYPVDETGSMRILAFTEFAFSLLEQYQQYYGLYIYIYNPQGFEIDDSLNTIKFADEYNSSNEPTNWNNYPLKLLSKDENNVLYKFKVLDCEEHSIVDTFARVALSLESRRYDINSIELHKKGDINADDYGIGGTWTFSGFGKGMHETSVEESTLTSSATFTDTVGLRVNHTYFRSWRNLSNTVADQLSSVYFAVDNSIDQQYDRLFALDFDMYKYLTSPIFCIYESYELFNSSILVDYAQVYENLCNQKGLSTEQVLNLDKYTWLCWDNFGANNTHYMTLYGVEIGEDKLKYLDKLAWVLPTKNQNDHNISSVDLQQYMIDFSEKYGKEINNKYSSLLFADHYYNFYPLSYQTFESGYVRKAIECDEDWELRGSLSQHTFWQQLSLLFKHETNVTDFCPIQKVDYMTDINGQTNDYVSKTFFIAESDVPSFRTFAYEQYQANKSVYLFRFDIDTYFTTDLGCENYGTCGYVSQEPVYLDFDIISLTYDKAGVKTVLPVVSSPIDIIADIQPPTTEPDWTLEIENMFSNAMTSFFTVVFGLVAIVGFVLLAYAFLKYLFGRR